MNYLKQKQKVSVSYNHTTREIETCISEGATYMYNNEQKGRKSSKIMFKRFMDTTDENDDSFLNKKENVPIIEIPVTDEPQNENVSEHFVQDCKKVRFCLSSSPKRHKKPVAEKPKAPKEDSNDACDDLNRTYTVSPKQRTPTPPIPSPPTPTRSTPSPRIARTSSRVSRQQSISRKSPIRPCKHRLIVDGSCQRCKIDINLKMFSPMSSPMDPEKSFANKAFNQENTPPCKSESPLASLPWPLPSRKELAPFIFVSPARGRFIIKKDTEIIYEALDRESTSGHHFVKYIFHVSKEGSKQVVTVSSPLIANQLLPDELSSPITTSRTLNEYSNLEQLEFHFPGYYKHICKALKIIAGRVPRIEGRNILDMKCLYARIMINGDFRLIFPNKKIFVHRYGKSDDAIECPNSEMSLDERKLFCKAREFLRDLDKLHRRTSGPNYHGIIVHAHLKSDNDSKIDGEV